MTYIFEIDDEIDASVAQFLNYQVVHEPDPDTGLPRIRKVYANNYEYFAFALKAACARPCEQFPTAAQREHIIAKKNAEQAFDNILAPTFDKAAAVQAAKKYNT